jgi:hypothetical protein
MAFNTKLDLYDGKAIQCFNQTLTLSGKTVIATSGDLRYQTHPTFTGNTQIVDKCYVDSASGGISGSNGLCRCGNNITLGGALTGATTITIPTTTCLLFTDSRVGTAAVGIQYTGDYCNNFTCLSIPNVSYVTGKTSQANCAISIAPKAVTGATNGICKYDCHNVCLTSINQTILTNAVTGATNLGTGNGTIYTTISDRKFQLKTLSGGTNITLTCNGNYIGINTPNISVPVTGAANGLSMSGANVVLGGTLTGSTTITDSRAGSAAVGIQYGADYCSNFTARSLVDAAYVTGKTNVINTVGTIGQVIYRDSTHLVGCANMIYCDTLPSFVFGRTNVVTGADSGSFGGTGSCVSGACSVIIGGISNAISTGNVRAAIIGGNSIKLTGTTYVDTVAVPSLAIMTTPTTCLGDVLTYDAITKKIGKTTLSALGGITGATNGLTVGSQKVCLGGALIGATSITGAQALCLGTVASKLATLDLHTAGNITIGAGNLLISSSGATFTDLTLVAKQGIKYASDYSLTYDPRSLVDKGYVDTVATGLQIHAAAIVATTVPITLSTNQTIDGVLTTTGMRVLVKNQADATTNGIYSANTGAWGRTSDFDASVEISNGDLIPVTSGSTQNSTIWVLTTPNPITLGTSNLVFTLFSTIIDVQAGAGIAISQVGGAHTVCVNLGTNSGLNTSSGLVIDSGIAGSGLTFTTGTLSVRAANGGSATSIPIKFNAGCCLVINCSDINTALNAITGATNGLTKQGQQVKLGGTITGATTLTLDSVSGSLLFTDSRVGSAAVGLQYTGDYDANFTARSLVDKGYVDACDAKVSGATLSCAESYADGCDTQWLDTATGFTQTCVSNCTISAGNGLTKLGDNRIVLGGSLTGDTNIDIAGHIFCINGALAANFICINDSTLASAFGLQYGACVASTTLQAECHSLALLGGAGGAIFTDSTPSTPRGIQYNGDYSATFCNNSLVTKYYVDNGFTGGTGIAFAGNGLTKAGNTVVLGGTLTGTTTINGIQNLRINVDILDFTGSTSINLTSPIITFQTTPPAGSTSDSVIVWNSGDKQLKTVAGASLGDKNNIYAKTTITSTPTTLTSGSTYVQLVWLGAPVTINLPANPIDGQVFKIKDISGNALTNNITIDGNGFTIDGDYAPALINTDYGALELMFTWDAPTGWFSLAFVN